MLATSIFAQLLTGIVLDQFGWLHIPQRSCTPLRGIGLGFALLGNMFIAIAAHFWERRYLKSSAGTEGNSKDEVVAELQTTLEIQHEAITESENGRTPVEELPVRNSDSEEGDLGIPRTIAFGSLNQITPVTPVVSPSSKPSIPQSRVDWKLIFAAFAGMCLALQAGPLKFDCVFLTELIGERL